MRKLFTFAFLLAFLGYWADAQVVGTYPYTQDFELSTACGTGCGAACTITNAPGWTNVAGDNLDWLVDAGGTSSGNTGPSVDHNPGTSVGKYLYVETSCSGTGYPNRQADLWSPEFDLSAGAPGYEMRLWHHQYGSAQGVTHFDVTTDNGTTWTNDVITAITGDQGDQWFQRVINLTPWVGDTVRVRVRHISGTSFTSDAAVDDFEVVALLGDDAGIAVIDSPSLPACSLDSAVYVTVFNYGIDTLTSATIHCAVNGTALPTMNWTGMLLPNTGDTAVFVGNTLINAGDTVTCWTSMPNGVVENPAGAGNDTSSVIVALGLTGTYQIGGAGSDYVNFNDALTDLNAFGVCGNVLFNVHDSTFNEQVILTEILGAGPNSTVTFRGISQTAELMTTTPSSAANYTVWFNGADYIHFENMTIANNGSTYRRVLDVNGGSHWNVFDGNIIRGDTNAFTTSNFATVIWSTNGGSVDNNNWFLNNTIWGGSYGAWWYGDATTSLETGTVFEGNTFLNQYYQGCRYYYQYDSKFNNNIITSNSTYTGTSYGTYFLYNDGASEYMGNHIMTNPTGRFPTWGSYFSNCDATSGGHAIIANNFISVGDPGYTGTMYGIYMTNSGYHDFIHNNILVDNPSTNSRAFYGTSGGGSELWNNNFVNWQTGYACYLASNFTVINADYNNYWTAGPSFNWFSAAQADLAAWQSASGFDANGTSVNPNYHGLNDLHVCNDTLNGAGTPTGITWDFDGQARDAVNPDIGADEFAPLVAGFLGPDQDLCTGDSTQLIAGAPSDTILWSTGATTPSIWVNTPGTYTVSVTGVCGSGSDTIIVNQSAIAYSGFLAADTTMACTGDTVNLMSTMSYDTYTWSTGGTAMTEQVTASGTYTLDVSDACGSGSESVTVTFIDAPTAAFTHSTSFLTGIFTDGSTAGGGTLGWAWDFGDGSGTSNLQNPNYVYGGPGSYFVTLTVTNECGTATFSDTVVVDTPGVGVDPELASMVSAFPNPSNGQFTLEMELPSAAGVNITVLSLQGQEVYAADLGQVVVYRGQVDLRHVAAGTYFLKIQAGDAYAVKRLIVE